MMVYSMNKAGLESGADPGWGGGGGGEDGVASYPPSQVLLCNVASSRCPPLLTSHPLCTSTSIVYYGQPSRPIV